MTLAGTLEAPAGEELEAARAAYEAASPASGLYGGFGDFTYYVLRVERVRWVGGYGRMDSTDADAFHAAEPDPVASGAAYAIEHLNADHADALLADGPRRSAATRTRPRPRACGSTATASTCTVKTPRGMRRDAARFAEPANRRATCGPPRSSSPSARA